MSKISNEYSTTIHHANIGNAKSETASKQNLKFNNLYKNKQNT